MSLLTCFTAGLEEAEQTAGILLDKSGGQGEFIVHVGCGDGRVLAVLWTKGPYLAYGLEQETGPHPREGGVRAY